MSNPTTAARFLERQRMTQVARHRAVQRRRTRPSNSAMELLQSLIHQQVAIPVPILNQRRFVSLLQELMPWIMTVMATFQFHIRPEGAVVGRAKSDTLFKVLDTVYTVVPSLYTRSPLESVSNPTTVHAFVNALFDLGEEGVHLHISLPFDPETSRSQRLMWSCRFLAKFMPEVRYDREQSVLQLSLGHGTSVEEKVREFAHDTAANLMAAYQRWVATPSLSHYWVPYDNIDDETREDLKRLQISTQGVMYDLSGQELSVNELEQLLEAIDV